VAGRRARAGAQTNTISQPTIAARPAAAKAPRHPSQRPIVPANTNEIAPAIPMLAAWPATARDMSTGSTRSASSLRPVM
jgi:hypothetical protein